MNCKNCGKEITDDSNFCKQCGYPMKDLSNMDEPYTYRYHTPLKDKIAAAVLSVVLPGLGQVYVGKTRRGVGLAIPGAILLIICISTGYMVWKGLEMTLWYASGAQSPFMLFFLAIIAYILMVIVNTFDACKLAIDYNAILKKTGSPPW